nr:hypothetical protein CFP56_52762 [Quercus suber]
MLERSAHSSQSRQSAQLFNMKSPAVNFEFKLTLPIVFLSRRVIAQHSSSGSPARDHGVDRDTLLAIGSLMRSLGVYTKISIDFTIDRRTTDLVLHFQDSPPPPLNPDGTPRRLCSSVVTDFGFQKAD